MFEIIFPNLNYHVIDDPPILLNDSGVLEQENAKVAGKVTKLASSNAYDISYKHLTAPEWELFLFFLVFPLGWAMLPARTS